MSKALKLLPSLFFFALGIVVVWYGILRVRGGCCADVVVTLLGYWLAILGPAGGSFTISVAFAVWALKGDHAINLWHYYVAIGVCAIIGILGILLFLFGN